MKCKVEKAKLTGIIACPPNKSYTHRAIFLASLAKGKSVIRNVLLSRDTIATINACKAFGAEISIDGSTVTVESKGKVIPQKSEIDATNSGTTIRISAAIAALSDTKIILTGDSSLKKRPMQPLLDALGKLGAACTSTDGKPPITVKGKILGGNTNISGSVSSQFISALLMAAPKTEKGITLEIEGDLVSKPYLDATVATMKKFGAFVNTILPYKKYNIPKQDYKPIDFTVPSDFSSVALILSAAVLIGDNMSIIAPVGDLPQGDREMLSHLEKLGVQVNIGDDVITVKSPQLLKGGRFDLSNTPDLLPPIAILALKTSGPIEIFNVRHARFKETDRIAILAQELSKLGVNVTEKEDGLILNAPGIIKSAELNSFEDHRLFMAFSISAMFVGNCTVTDPDSVYVSYPTFIDDMNRIGAKILV
ncbi:MAG: 3-phosphoshikimate 1-carboxyvinyltransferase [Thaumarchaeota archaeon 13_1_40CM_38_12]|nr:MAG: 3-phosphoshikimate 1-carboxyvinyltransferase [Thaumarchaeota archaeon 13_1_40CM_38_12]OLC91873.1 MAG: 3-phosphoshikimate 1-carboxyvinyltransferase [Thaumarchaeota archaeon 13_1_40CM_3_38_6]